MPPRRRQSRSKCPGSRSQGGARIPGLWSSPSTRMWRWWWNSSQDMWGFGFWDCNTPPTHRDARLDDSSKKVLRDKSKRKWVWYFWQNNQQQLVLPCYKLDMISFTLCGKNWVHSSQNPCFHYHHQWKHCRFQCKKTVMVWQGMVFLLGMQFFGKGAFLTSEDTFWSQSRLSSWYKQPNK